MQNVDTVIWFPCIAWVFSFTDKDGLTYFGISEGRYGEINQQNDEQMHGLVSSFFI